MLGLSRGYVRRVHAHCVDVGILKIASVQDDLLETEVSTGRTSAAAVPFLVPYRVKFSTDLAT
jgi:hypothetical protein